MPKSTNERLPSMATESKPSSDPWANAPQMDILPFVTAEERAQLVNSGATVKVTHVEYDRTGQYGPKFVVTFIHPDGDARQMSMTSQSGKTPRDQINKWMWSELRTGTYPDGISARICKRGRAYMFDKPGAESERDNTVTTEMASSGNSDMPDF